MTKPIDLKAAKAAIERKRYGALVLAEFNKQAHQDKRQQREQAAEVRRQARNQI